MYAGACIAVKTARIFPQDRRFESYRTSKKMCASGLVIAVSYGSFSEKSVSGSAGISPFWKYRQPVSGLA